MPTNPHSHRRALPLALLATLSLAPRTVVAQYFAARTVTPVPADDSTRGTGFLGGLDYFIDMQRSGGSAGDDRAWGVRIGALIDLWRPSPRTSVYISAADEIAANSLKDGGFNPRGISWELGAGVAHRYAHLSARLGIVHYCKHEVDNSDPPGEEQTPPPGYVPQKRTLSMNALRLEIVSNRWQQGRWTLRGAAAGEAYVNQWDGRRPALDLENSWKRARLGASAALRADAAVGGGSVFARASGIALHFTEGPDLPVTSPIHHNERLELGWRLVRRGGAMEAYGAVERLFDDVMVVTPRRSTMVGVGVRFTDLTYF